MNSEITIFIIENENHSLNFNLYPTDNTKAFYIFLDNFSGMRTFNPKNEKYSLNNTFLPNSKENIAFNTAKFFEKFTLLIELQKQIKDWLHKNHLLNQSIKIITGGDGALQRSIIKTIKSRNRSISTELWIDTIMGDRPRNFRNLLRIKVNMLEPIICKIGYSQFFPSILGTSNLINHIYVSHESNKDVLIRRGVSPHKITVADSPRLSWLKQQAKENMKPGSILFVAGAWEWHNRKDVEDWQLEVIKSLIVLFNENNSLEKTLKIQMHPRQSKYYRENVDIAYISDIPTLEQAILETELVVSFRSSALYDAKLLEKKCYVYEAGAPVTPTNSFIDSLPKLQSLADLLN